MFIEEAVIEVCEVFPYQAEYMEEGLSEPVESKRAFACKNNLLYSKIDLGTAAYISNYIASQHVKELQNFVPRKHNGVALPAEPDMSYFLNTTYFDRICHLVVVPLRGSVTYEYGATNVQFELTAGKAYMVNNRAPRKIVKFDSQFKALATLWIDFDLAYYLKEHDGNSVFDRRADEYFKAASPK